MVAAITATGLSVSFGEVHAVDQLDLDVPAGVVYGFLGPNGAGKSTTIRLLLGLIEPDAGTAAIVGHDVRTDGDDARASCGVLLDDDGLYDRLTAAENLEFFGRVWGVAPLERRARAEELLTHIGLAHRGRDRLGTWSLGMRKKLAVARAMFHRPPVVFLDEPTNGLDPPARRALHNDIVTLARVDHATVFLTTHDLDEAERTCDRVGIMARGRLIAEGTPDELRQRAQSGVVRLRGTELTPAVVHALEALPSVAAATVVDQGVDVELRRSADSAAPVVRTAVECGAELETVDRSDSSLEDAFMEVVGEQHDATTSGSVTS